mmetsp:Transcript_21560/g.43471  ORF Transcript_21560/g.43471 Transcript_21560/m.43471 type:complete len:268 (-) Transcript_21560:253-1056(-)
MGACGGGLACVDDAAELEVDQLLAAQRAEAPTVLRRANSKTLTPRPVSRSKTVPVDGPLPRLGLHGGHREGEQPRITKRARTARGKELQLLSDATVQEDATCISALPAGGGDDVKAADGHALRPDFSGMWVCTSVEGDWDKFLREQGTSWAMRKAAAGLGYGVGKQVQSIEQDAGVIRITNIVSQYGKKDESTFRLDGGAERITNLEGRQCLCVTAWDGDKLVTRETSFATSQPNMTVRRWLSRGCLCTERTSRAGTMVRRFYRRRD